MKLKTILCTAGLMLAFLSQGKAQTPQHDSIRIHIIENENGVMTNIDTTVAASQHGQLMLWLSSQGIETPAAPPMQGDSLEMMFVEVITDDIQGDSSHRMVVRVINDDSISGNGQNMKFIAAPPHAPEAPLVPSPPMMVIKTMPPPAPGEKGNDMQIIIIKDSAGVQTQQCTKTVIVNGNQKTAVSKEAPSYAKKAPEVKDLVIYPNPSNGHITLAIDMPGKGKAELTISDMNGKIVYSESLPESTEKISKEIDLSKNGKGTYNVRVQKGGNVVVEQVIIQ